MTRTHYGTMHMMQRALSKMKDALEEKIDEATLSQFVVLAALNDQPTPVNQTELVKLTGIDRSTVADIIRRLMKKRLVMRARSKKDARCYLVRISTEGQELLKSVRPAIAVIEETFLSQLTQRQREDLAIALERLATAEFETSEQRQAA